MKKNIYIKLFIASLTIIWFGNSCTSRNDTDVVLTVEEKSFSQAELFIDVDKDRFIKLDSIRREKEMLGYARRQIIIMESEERQLDQQEDVRNQLREVKTKMIVNQVVEEEVWGPLKSDSSLKVLYVKMGREVGFLHILITHKGSRHSQSERSEADALALAIDIKQKIESGELSFGDAVNLYSEEPYHLKSSEVKYIRWGAMIEPIQSTAFSLELRQISDPVKSYFGFHIVRTVGMKTVSLKPFEEMKPELVRFLFSRKGKEFDLALNKFESWLSHYYSVSFNEETLDSIMTDLPRVHAEKEGAVKVGELTQVEIKGILFTAGGEPYDIKWLKNQITGNERLISQALILNKKSLKLTIEHLMYRYLCTIYADEKRGEKWFFEIEKKVKREQIDVLRKVLIADIQKNEPNLSRDKTLDFVYNLYDIKINEDFVSGFGKTVE